MPPECLWRGNMVPCCPLRYIGRLSTSLSIADYLCYAYSCRALLNDLPPCLPPSKIRVYDDEDGARKEEIAQLRLGGSDNVFR